MSAAPALTLDHVRAIAAWLSHGPGTIRQVATRADMCLVDLHPRSIELVAVGALAPMGQSDTEGPIYALQLAEVVTPSAADVVERKINSLSPADQVSIAAGIMARHARRGRRPGRSGDQPEIELAGDASEISEALAPARPFALE